MHKSSLGGSIFLPITSEVWRGDTCGSTDSVQVKCTKINLFVRKQQGKPLTLSYLSMSKLISKIFEEVAVITICT